MNNVKIVSGIGIVLTISLSIVFAQLPAGNYKVQNLADGLHLTIQGVNTSYAGVVGDTWLGYGEQRWSLIKNGYSGYQLLPEKYRSNNVLSFYKDPVKKYPQPENWSLKEVRTTGKLFYQLINDRTKNCLTSYGRRKDVSETRCDVYQRNQQWSFQKI